MISEEHWENDEISFRNVYEHMEPVKLRLRAILITYCVRAFLFYGYTCMKKENVIYHSARKVIMELDLMIRDIPN